MEARVNLLRVQRQSQRQTRHATNELADEWQGGLTSHSCSCRALKSDRNAICAAHPSLNDAMMLWISPLMQFTLPGAQARTTSDNSTRQRCSGTARRDSAQAAHSRIVLHHHHERSVQRALQGTVRRSAAAVSVRSRLHGHRQHRKYGRASGTRSFAIEHIVSSRCHRPLSIVSSRCHR